MTVGAGMQLGREGEMGERRKRGYRNLAQVSDFPFVHPEKIRYGASRLLEVYELGKERPSSPLP